MLSFLYSCTPSVAVESNKERKTKAGRCVDDVLEIRNVFSGGAESLVGSFCGDGGAVMPGPAASDPGATELKSG